MDNINAKAMRELYTEAMNRLPIPIGIGTNVLLRISGNDDIPINCKVSFIRPRKSVIMFYVSKGILDKYKITKIHYLVHEAIFVAYLEDSQGQPASVEVDCCIFHG